MNIRDAYRVVDANLNRASEGLRTIEEVARLVQGDSRQTQSLKQLRHQLQSLADGFDRHQLLSARDVAGDVGTSATTAQESQRQDEREIIAAAASRFQQAIRCIEEFSKIIDPLIAKEFESLRYQSYDLLRDIELQTLRPFPFDATLYLLVDCTRPLDLYRDFVKEVAHNGVDFLQIRDKKLDDRALIEYAEATKRALEGSSTKLIINDRVDIAMAVQADGVHLGQEDLPIKVVRAMVGRSMWIGVSTHSLQQAQEAELQGADYIGCGPTFPSQTKNFEEFKGLSFLEQVSKTIRVPAFAIGGIDLSRLGEVLASGVSRIAVSHCIASAPSPGQAATQLKNILSHPGSKDSRNQKSNSLPEP